MSLSVRETALRAIATLLGAAGSPASHVFRSRLEQIDNAELPCFDIAPGEERISEGEFGDHNSVSRTLPIAVRVLLDAATQEPNAAAIDDSALDPFYVFAVQQLTGNGANLGGVVHDVKETAHATVFQPFGRDILGLEMNFELQFATRRGDPTVLA